MKTIKARVTQNDINTGSQIDPLACPISQALQRKGLDCYVGDDSTDIEYPGGSKSFEHDEFVANWIALFDIDRNKVEPFDMVLDVNSEQLVVNHIKDLYEANPSL